MLSLIPNSQKKNLVLKDMSNIVCEDGNASNLTQSNCSTIYKTLGGSNTICLPGKNVPGNLILRIYIDQNIPLLHFPSPFSVLQLERKHHSIEWQSEELAKGEGSGMSGEGEKFPGDKMGRRDATGIVFSNIVLPLKPSTSPSSPSNWRHRRP